MKKIKHFKFVRVRKTADSFGFDPRSSRRRIRGRQVRRVCILRTLKFYREWAIVLEHLMMDKPRDKMPMLCCKGVCGRINIIDFSKNCC